MTADTTIQDKPLGISLGELAKEIEARLEGDGRLMIRGVAGIREAGSGQISFVANSRYQSFMDSTKASALIVSNDLLVEADIPLLRCSDPYLAYQKALQLFAPVLSESFLAGIHPSAVIDPDAVLGENCHIGALVHLGTGVVIGEGCTIMSGCVVQDGASIGSGSVLFPNVVVRERVRIGDRVTVHSGTVIGSDGFGYAFEGGRFEKIPQIGTVEICDDVEIGANVTIDRATTGVTRLGKGCKVDNLVQIAHNVEIGEHSIIVAQVGISGSTQLGEYVSIGGQAGISGHLEIGAGARIGAQAGVTKSVAAGSSVSGYPARVHDEALRIQANLLRLPKLLDRVRKLEEELSALRLGQEKAKEAR